MKVKLTVRNQFNVRDFKWITIWSEEANKSLGELILEKDFNGGTKAENASNVLSPLIGVTFFISVINLSYF